MLANTAHDEAIRQAIITWPKRKRRAAIAKRREGPQDRESIREDSQRRKMSACFEWQLDEVTCGLDCGVLSEGHRSITIAAMGSRISIPSPVPQTPESFNDIGGRLPTQMCARYSLTAAHVFRIGTVPLGSWASIPVNEQKTLQRGGAPGRTVCLSPSPDARRGSLRDSPGCPDVLGHTRSRAPRVLDGLSPGDIGLQNGYRFTRAFKLGLFAPAPPLARRSPPRILVVSSRIMSPAGDWPVAIWPSSFGVEEDLASGATAASFRAAMGSGRPSDDAFLSVISYVTGCGEGMCSMFPVRARRDEPSVAPIPSGAPLRSTKQIFATRLFLSRATSSARYAKSASAPTRRADLSRRMLRYDCTRFNRSWGAGATASQGKGSFSADSLKSLRSLGDGRMMSGRDARATVSKHRPVDRTSES
jgi:hypothetical protein